MRSTTGENKAVFGKGCWAGGGFVGGGVGVPELVPDEEVVPLELVVPELVPELEVVPLELVVPELVPELDVAQVTGSVTQLRAVPCALQTDTSPALQPLLPHVPRAFGVQT